MTLLSRTFIYGCGWSMVIKLWLYWFVKPYDHATLSNVHCHYGELEWMMKSVGQLDIIVSNCNRIKTLHMRWLCVPTYRTWFGILLFVCFSFLFSCLINTYLPLFTRFYFTERGMNNHRVTWFCHHLHCCNVDSFSFPFILVPFCETLIPLSSLGVYI